MILYRHTPPRLPFLWEVDDQPPGRWHGAGEGPVQYLADTPDGAWAEFLRHEEIADPADLLGVQRAIWAIEVPDDEVAALPRPALAPDVLRGGTRTYATCRRQARQLRRGGAGGLRTPSAALAVAGAHGWFVRDGLRVGPARDGEVVALFGARPDLQGWPVVHAGRPDPALLQRVRRL